MRGPRSSPVGDHPFRLIADYAYECEHWFDTDGRLRWVNSAVKRVLGYTPDECLAMADYPMPIVHPDDRPRVADMMAEPGRASEGHNVHLRLLHRDGGTRRVALSWHPMYDDDGTFLGHRSSLLNVSELVETRGALERDRRQLLSIFDGIDEVIYVADPTTYELLYVNEAARRQFGDEILGRKCYQALQNLDAPCDFCTNDRIFGANLGKPYVWEFRNQKTGCWFRCIDKAVRWPDGRMVRYELAVDITDRRRLESDLREREAMLSAAERVGQIGSWQWELDTNKILVSAGWQQIHGLYREHLTPDELLPLAHPDDLPSIQQALEKVRSGDAKYNLVHRIIRANTGEVRTVRVRGELVCDDSGRATRFVGMGQDITESKQREQRLAEKQEQLRTIFKSTPDFLILKDAEGRFKAVNPAFCEFIGLSESELIGKTDFDIFPAAEAEAFAQSDREALATGEPVIVDETGTGHDGALVVQTIKTPLIDANGQTTGILVTVRDITERKRIEEALRDSEQQRRAMLDSMSEMFAYYDLDLNIIWTSKAASDSVGQPPEQLVGRKCYEVWHQRETTCEHCPVTLARETGEQHESEVQTPDGRFWFLRGCPVFDEEGKMVGLAEFGQEITARKRAAAELLAAKQAAEAASHAKTAFLANVSHEIRTPMTSILGYTDLLLSGTLEPSQQDNYLHTLRRNAENLLELLNNVLDLSKIEQGHLQVAHEACRVADIVDDVAEMFSVVAQQKGLELHRRIGANVPPVVRTDAGRLRQILVNLVGNAVKFTDEGGVNISATADAPARGKVALQFKVADSGIGIPEEHLAKLFQPFTQADVSTTRRYGGTGLGLAIAKHLALALGGDITARRTPGGGSTFIVEILAEQAEPSNKGPAAAGDGLGPATSERASDAALDQHAGAGRRLAGRLLLAEDCDDVRHLVALLLRTVGLEVVEAENGRIACEMAEKSQTAGRPFHVILMDIHMPELDGYQATRRLRAEGWTRAIIALTADAMRADRQRCLAAGFDDYLAKPVRQRTLLDAIQCHLPRREVNEASAGGDGPGVERSHRGRGENSAEHERAEGRGETGPMSSRSPGEYAAARPLGSGFVAASELEELVQQFRAELPERIEAIRSAHLADEHEEIEHLAHRLKGAAGMYGLTRLAELARRLQEMMATGSHDDGRRELVEQLAAVCEEEYVADE